MVVVDPTSWPRFFIRATVGPASRPRFFVGAIVGLAIGRAVGLATGGAVLTGADVAVSFFGLFLW